jgi:hypothetical protein
VVTALGEAGGFGGDADAGGETLIPPVGGAAETGDFGVAGAPAVEEEGWTVDSPILSGFFPSAIAAMIRMFRDSLGSFMIASNQF